MTNTLVLFAIKEKKKTACVIKFIAKIKWTSVFKEVNYEYDLNYSKQILEKSQVNICVV